MRFWFTLIGSGTGLLLATGMLEGLAGASSPTVNSGTRHWTFCSTFKMPSPPMIFGIRHVLRATGCPDLPVRLGVSPIPQNTRMQVRAALVLAKYPRPNIPAQISQPTNPSAPAPRRSADVELRPRERRTHLSPAWCVDARTGSLRRRRNRFESPAGMRHPSGSRTDPAYQAHHPRPMPGFRQLGRP
jgi:hypothetical protein